MSVYSMAVFLHIVGALGIFAAIGLEWAGLSNLRRATDTAQVRNGSGCWPRREPWQGQPRFSSSSPAST